LLRTAKSNSLNVRPDRIRLRDKAEAHDGAPHTTTELQNGKVVAAYNKLQLGKNAYGGGIWTTVKSVAPLAAKGEPVEGVSAPLLMLMAKA
jgi:hypothetical protein